MKSQNKIILGVGSLSLAIAQSLAAAPTDADPVAAAAASGGTSESSNSGGGSGVEFGGFIRSETAINTNKANVHNQLGNSFNGVPIARPVILPPPSGTGVPDVATRIGGKDDASLNMQMFRAQFDAKMHFNDALTGVVKMRILYDPGWYDEYSPAAFGSHAVGKVYQDPNYFKYYTQGLARPNPLEWAGSSYMVDLPAFFLEYNNGPLNVRLGNQQIAWGQSLFFRVLDVPDGLDLRRHSIFDYAPEEYSDKRVPALGLRANYQFNNGWLLDGYVQKFQPSVLGNPNTPYNIIFSQFTVHDMYANYNDKMDFGLRAKGEIGAFGVQAIYAHRYNPDGVFRWTQSGVNRGIPGAGVPGSLLACTPFEADPTGVWSANEWFKGAAESRLNAIQALRAAANDFPCSQALTGGPLPQIGQGTASAILNTFFQVGGLNSGGLGFGGLRGHLAREYKQEDNFGGGITYTFSGAPGSITDQLILNWEVLYTPNRTFTAPDLNINFLKTNEWVSNISLEKYQRFFDNLPATYLVAEFMYKSKSDLFGRYTGSQDGGGYNGSEFTNASGHGGGFKAVAFAVQQPFPNLVWRFDLSVLYDLQGGVLVQPAVRWKPNTQWTAEIFYNYINAKIGGNPNKNMFGALEFANELSVRVGYQF